METRQIWIDCLCINQVDSDEKILQIPLMAEIIYQRAKRTIVWLRDAPDMEQVLSLFLDLEDRPWNFDIPEDSPEMLKNAFDWNYSQRSIQFSILEAVDLRFRALSRLLENPWFFRIWSLQEVIFSSQSHIRAGSVWIDWDLFSTVMKLFSDPQTHVLVGRETLLLHLGDRRDHLRKIFLSAHSRDVELSRQKTGQQLSNFCQLITNMWSTEASNSCDMIYGLYNLCKEAGDPAFRANYDIQPNKLYVKYARECLQRKELQEALTSAGVGYEHC